MFGIRTKLRSIKNKRIVFNLMNRVVSRGYDSLSDEEKVDLTKATIQAYPEMNKFMFEGLQDNLIENVIDGKVHDRYKDVLGVVDSAMNSLMFGVQYDAFVQALTKILEEEDYDDIVVFHAAFGWNIDLKQRPQHLAEAFSNERTLYIYRTDLHQDKGVYSIKKEKDNLYLVNLDMYTLKLAFFDVVKKINKPKYLHAYATCLYDVPYERIKSYIDEGFKVLYDFVDEISSEISGVEVTEEMTEGHNKLLKDKDNVIVISTAGKLKRLAEDARGCDTNSVLAPNGVNLDDFDLSKVKVAKKMKAIVDKGNPIIGYYGALAAWFDYSKVKKLAEERKDYEIVLIGINYDKTYNKSGLNKLDNVHYLGIVEYKELINYSSFFDVCTVPFIKNDITDSTSPVKIFEYMALEKPIVTTDINECKKYESCQIAHSDDEFIEKIDLCLNKLKDDKEYKALLKKEASENTWAHRSQEIKKFMK